LVTNFDIEAFEERAAIMEFDGGMSRFRAETLAAEAQGVKRHEAIRIGHSAQARDQRSGSKRQSADDMPGVQRRPKEEAGSVPERVVQAGRDSVVLPSLRLERR
jgi:hypothetical protein